MTPALAPCPDTYAVSCACICHSHPVIAEMSGPVYDEPVLDRPRSGWLIVWVAVILMVAGLLLAGYAFMGMRS